MSSIFLLLFVVVAIFVAARVALVSALGGHCSRGCHLGGRTNDALVQSFVDIVLRLIAVFWQVWSRSDSAFDIYSPSG